MTVLVFDGKNILTPFANDHLECIKGEASKYTVGVIKDDEYTVWRKSAMNNPHIVNWSKRSCSNCHFYAENLMPCVHLYAIWINHKASGIPTMDALGQWSILSKNESAYGHLFGKCYLVSTLKLAVENVSHARPGLGGSCPPTAFFRWFRSFSRTLTYHMNRRCSVHLPSATAGLFITGPPVERVEILCRLNIRESKNLLLGSLRLGCHSLDIRHYASASSTPLEQ